MSGSRGRAMKRGLVKSLAVTNGLRMKTHQFSLLCAMVAFCTTLLSGCGDANLEWKEEVRLQTGDLIVVGRTAKFSENWVAGGGGGSFNKGMTVAFIQPVKSDNP